ncbi:MAG: UDP-N-acetylmuramoyl-L-alanyl-D-glutamate--2,6-diaminopimelate ligase [Clostridia bacterium]|nr:UDP-N-acetylmuramoyl-L-alanyl-D-glutamate--2,6-diaminopimelate ligase [Clostridia bacterium]
MLLKELLPEDCGRLAALEIAGVTCNSKDVKSGYAFVCIKGTALDGHDFAKSALTAGAAVVITQRELGLNSEITVENTRKTYAQMCARWFGNPAGKLRLIGVTGTNGKTSVTYMIKSILEEAGYKVGLIGTIQNLISNTVIGSHTTTPEAHELNSLFSQMVNAGCDFCVMEASSHALDQYRVCDLPFEIAIFTNLTQDHLDYHKTMENYLAAKKKLFSMCKTAIINADDAYAAQLAEGLSCKVITCSTGNNGLCSARSVKYRPDSTEYELLYFGKLNHIKVSCGGAFTVYNSMLAAVAALESGIGIENVQAALLKMHGVKGRAEVVPTGRDFTVIIDYAHTPDGLKNILLTFKECEKNRLVVLFGCGGDRDKGKRPIMGNIAVRNADFVIVTSDNPRTEEPMAIIEDILEGTRGFNTPLKVIENRVEAIKYAVSIAQAGDIIVLAGKGHETYQILKDKTIHLDEREVIKEALNETGGEQK